MTTLNINQMVTVKLTAHGASEYEKYIVRTGNRRTILREGDTIRTQMWDLMGIFSNCIHLGMPAPFVDCEIEIL